jgi:hypothetical protein
MLPPGSYFIGDPTFALSNERLSELTAQQARLSSTDFEIDGHQGWVAVTPLEEMTATSSNAIFEIMSGRLAVIPTELLLGEDDLEVDLEDVGEIKTFKRVFTCEETPTIISVGRMSISLEANDEEDAELELGEGDDYF